MSNILIICVGIVYLIIGVDLMIKTQTGLSIAYLAYAISNIGLYLAANGY